MDVVWFHISNRMEVVQMYLHSASLAANHLWQDALVMSHQIYHSVLNAQYPAYSQMIRERVLAWLAVVREHLMELYRRAVETRFSDFCESLWHLLVNEISRTTWYIGGAGFLLGGAVGITVGLSLQRGMSTSPRKMRAVICTCYAGLDAVCVSDEVCLPKVITSDEVLVQVKAASVDLMDVKICSGYGQVLRRHLNKYNGHVKNEFPIILGRDCSGVVVETGYQVSRFEPGEDVWFAVPYWSQGLMSEFVVVPESVLSKKPQNVTYDGAASLPFASIVAWDALVEKGGLNPDTMKDKRVLIHAGGSSVGCIAIQLVKAWSGHVTTTVSRRSAQLVHILGADDIIVYNETNYEKELEMRESFDIILNTVGSVLHSSCLPYCKPRGCVITTVASPITSDSYGFVLGTFYALWIRLRLLFTRRGLLHSSFSTINMSPTILDHVGKLVESGQVKPIVEKSFNILDAELAYQHISKGDTVGKTVVCFRYNNHNIQQFK